MIEAADEWVASATLDDGLDDDHVSSPRVGGAHRYTKTALIGEGGMGCVWLGWDAQIERNVAIKVARGDPGSPFAAKLAREVSVMASLTHPGVPAVHDVFTQDGHLHVVMELVRGHTLAELLDDTPRATLTRHVLDACEVIAHAHDRGSLHRDLTPSNVLVEPNGSTRVIDWGMAASMDDAAGGLPAGGTPGFMSPEQRGARALDARADVWALGALLHVVLFGEPPGTPFLTNTPLEAICARALSAEVGDRYEDASHMSMDLLAWFEGRRIEAFETSTWRTMRGLFARHARVVAASGAFAVLLLAVLAWGVMSTRDEARRAHRAESEAREQGRLASLASARARREADESAASEAQLRLDAARAALEGGHILEARALLERMRGHIHRPEARGLIMQLALIPRPELLARHPSPACPGTLHLTPDPEVLLCEDGARWTARVHGEVSWAVDLTETLRAHGSSFIKESRVFRGALYVRANRAGVFSIDLGSGRVERVYDGFARFASNHSVELLSQDTHHILLSNVSAPCVERVTQTYSEGEGGRVTTCTEGTVVLEDASSRRVIYDGSLGFPVEYVRVSSTGEPWIGTSDGVLMSLDRPSKRFDVDAPVRYIEAIPGTASLLIQRWDRVWAILDTNEGEWLMSFDEATHSVRPTSRGVLQALTTEHVELWSFPESELMRTYDSDFGLTDLAWSRDGRHIAMTSGGARYHHFSPFAHTSAEPISFGLDVMKSVAALPDGGFASVNVIEEPGAPLRRVDLAGGALVTSPIVPAEKWTLEARRIEAIEPDALVFTNTAGQVGVLDLSARDRVVRIVDTGDGVFDLSAPPSRAWSIALGKRGIYRVSLKGLEASWAAPEGARYVAAASDGRVAAVTRDALIVFDASGVVTHTIAVDSIPTSVTWRPGSSTVMTGHLDGVVNVWDIDSGTLTATLDHHDGLVSSLAVSPDGRLLASASWDTVLRIVSLDVLDHLVH